MLFNGTLSDHEAAEVVGYLSNKVFFFFFFFLLLHFFLQMNGKANPLANFSGSLLWFCVACMLSLRGWLDCGAVGASSHRLGRHLQ